MKIDFSIISSWFENLKKEKVNPEINILSQKKFEEKSKNHRDKVIGTTLFFVLINILLFFATYNSFVIPAMGTYSNYQIKSPFTFNIYKSSDEIAREKEYILNSIFPTVRQDYSKQETSLENILKLENAVLNTVRTPLDTTIVKVSRYDEVKNLISVRTFDAFCRDTINLKKLTKILTTNVSAGILDVKFVGSEKEKQNYLKKYRGSQGRVVDVRINYLELLKEDKAHVVSKDSYKVYEEVIVDIFTTVKNTLGVKDEFLLSTNEFLSAVILPSIFYDKRAYDSKVDEKFSEISDVKGQFVKGLTIVEKGDIVSAEKYVILKALKAEMETVGWNNNAQTVLKKVLNITLFNVILLMFLINLKYFDFKEIISKKNINYFAVLTFFFLLSLVSVVLYRTGNDVLSNLFSGNQSINLAHVDWVYLFPTGIVGMIITQFFGLIIGIIFSLYFALFNSLIWGASIEMFFYTFFVSIIISYSIRRVKYFSHYILYMSFVVLISAIVVSILFSSFKFEVDKNLIISNLVLVGVSSGITLILGMILIIIFQRISGIITPMKLLELSDMNHPLLRELSTKAPGTYHHSLLISQLAEASATAIGANSLLARVTSMYHDIGKIYKPEYFIENQNGVNIHDRHKPSISAKIIRNHVKKGVEYAQKYKLPQEIIDGIVEHHGTTVVKYFYDKAKNESEWVKVGEEIKMKESVEEIEFSYPGPKPQSKITGILMIADNFEAVIRILKDKSSNSLYKTITDIINKKIEDRQLEECNLTFTDLDKIKDAMVKRASSFFHVRIDYKEVEKKD